MTDNIGQQRENRLLTRFMVLALGAAVTTISLKAVAAAITGSVGFLSDALESGVNLVAAVFGLIILRVAARPPDASHHFGHGKAEYLSAMVEGAMIFVAATAIIWSAIERLISPEPLEQAGLGLALSAIAAAVNLFVGLTLQRAGARYRSVTLVADGKHLMTDVWTSAGVLVAIALVALTGWEVLDPLIALAVGVNILWTGNRLLRGSVSGLLSAALPAEDEARIDELLTRYRTNHPVDFAPLRTVASGRQRYVFVAMTVPPDWTVQGAHEFADRIESDVEAILPQTETLIHIEPANSDATPEAASDPGEPASG